MWCLRSIMHSMTARVAVPRDLYNGDLHRDLSMSLHFLYSMSSEHMFRLQVFVHRCFWGFEVISNLDTDFISYLNMMMSRHANIFRINGILWGIYQSPVDSLNKHGLGTFVQNKNRSSCKGDRFKPNTTSVLFGRTNHICLSYCSASALE